MTLLTPPTRRRAIAYYRHSAEDKQENSVAIQRGHAEKFARTHNIEIIHEEADEGKSGLSANRAGFQNLFNNWILNERAPPFEYVLVYDVSRWGRFQNPDEGAMYQYRCTERGKKIVFVEKGKLEEEHALGAHLITSIERFMAAEYSRQLSGKVFHGCVKVSQEGYSAGGIACYGMSRLLLDTNKNPVRILKKGEHKQISNERITFTPSNDEATAVVKKIFTLCALKGHGPQHIALYLNESKIAAPNGKLWSSAKVRHILTNESYAGTHTYNKRWGRLKQKTRVNVRSEWVVYQNAFPAIIDQEVFQKAQANLLALGNSSRTATQKIQKLQRAVENDIYQTLNERGVGGDTVRYVIKNFPLSFSLSFNRDAVAQWCFYVPEHMKNFDYIFAIGVHSEDGEKSPYTLRIPMTAFTQQNYRIVSEEEIASSKFLTDQRDLEDSVQKVCDKMIKHAPMEILARSGAEILD